MNQRLFIWHEGRLVGELWGGGREGWILAYAPDWRRDGFPVSVRFPLDASTYVGDEVEAFFDNLLPEGSVRDAVARRHGLSPGNSFGLLAAIGGDCAGALSLIAEGEAEAKSGDYVAIDEATLAGLVERDDPLAHVEGDRVRLSLAGAQGKIPVHIAGGQVLLPRGGAASTHILKVDGRLRGLVVNEVFTMGLARRCGLEVCDTSLRFARADPMLVVGRYDRCSTGEGVGRLHQEDLAQALGRPAHLKYEQEGGPSFAEVFDAVGDRSVDPLRDRLQLLRWLIFDVVVGNADAHAKNLSLVYTREGLRLAPFYDLVITRAFPRVARRLAMSIDGAFDPDRLRAEDWIRLARRLQVRPRLILDLGRAVIDAVERAAPAVRAELEQEHGALPQLEAPLRALSKTVRCARFAFAKDG